jgi:transcriptional regulator with XRE-family HTH domain
MAAMSKTKAPPNRIRAMRTAMGIEPEHLAEKLGVSVSTVWRWEERRTTIPDPRKIALAAFFRTSVDWLMVWPQEPAERDGENVA